MLARGGGGEELVAVGIEDHRPRVGGEPELLHLLVVVADDRRRHRVRHRVLVVGVERRVEIGRFDVLEVGERRLVEIGIVIGTHAVIEGPVQFKDLQFIVIDETHTYRGVFGSHVANVIRRLKRIAKFYGAKPQFILASATIGNPKELADLGYDNPTEAD